MLEKFEANWNLELHFPKILIRDCFKYLLLLRLPHFHQMQLCECALILICGFSREGGEKIGLVVGDGS